MDTLFQMEKPQVSIVIPVYNAGPFLVDAIASMVEQTFVAWEMICVNDGSKDASGPILNWFASQDSRIRVIHQENQGIVAALNAGCSEALSPWICRMDADDIAFPDRLQKQWTFVNDHPDCVAVGSAVLEMDSKSRPLGIQFLPTEHDSIVSRLHSRQPGLFHPTTFIRTEAFRRLDGYRREFQWVEDHDLWMRLAGVGKLANIREPLLCYRLHASSICGQRRQTQAELMDRLMQAPSTKKGVAESTPAGPGKWARAAMRGGYPYVAFLHLAQVFREQGPSRYALRMTAELGLRLLPSLGKQLRKRSPRVPNTSHWRKRLPEFPGVENKGLVRDR